MIVVMRNRILFCAAVFIMIVSLLEGQVKSEFETRSLQFFKDLSETRTYTLGRPVKPVPTPDGSNVVFLRGGARDPVMRLYELDVKTGETKEIMNPAQILRGEAEKLSVEEHARRERMRLSFRGFTDFQL